MEHLEVILSLAGACLGLVVAVATVAAKYARSDKAKKIAERTIEIGGAILPYIERAEALAGCGGDEKKERVMAELEGFAKENGLAFDAEAASAAIEKLIAFSKRVNAGRASQPTESE